MFALFCLANNVATAHGVEVSVTRERALLQGEVREAGGPLIVGMPVMVFSSSEPMPLFTGRSDPSGRFQFKVDPNQAYRVVIDDGLGHRAVADVAPVPPTEQPVSVPPQREPHDSLPWRAWLVGLGVIAALTVGAGWAMNRRRPR